jgi:DNA-binding response OmpR family regulator
MPTVGKRIAGAPTDHGDAYDAGHVLIADGDEGSRESLVTELHAAGFRVSVARTGFEAIVKATCHLPDLILLDENLPDMSANDTGRLITTCPTTSHIPIVRVRTGRRLPKRVFTQLRRRAV